MGCFLFEFIPIFSHHAEIKVTRGFLLFECNPRFRNLYRESRSLASRTVLETVVVAHSRLVFNFGGQLFPCRMPPSPNMMIHHLPCRLRRRVVATMHASSCWAGTRIFSVATWPQGQTERRHDQNTYAHTHVDVSYC